MNYDKHISKPIDDSPAWEVYEDCYNKNFLHATDKKDRIPKKLHQIWLGGELPSKYYRLRDTWLKIHPDWDYKLWTDEDAMDFDMINREAFDKIENLGAKSDLFRYEILYKHGGLYFDTDFQCVKPFDDLLHLDFFMGNGWNETPVVFNGLIASAPGNEFLKTVMDKVKEKAILSYYRLDKIMHFAGNYFLTDIFVEYLKTTKDKAVLFPKDFFYPMPNSIREEIRDDSDDSRKRILSYVTDVTYAIHLWHVSWVHINVPSSVFSNKIIRCQCGGRVNVPLDYTTECPRCNYRYRIFKSSRKARPRLYLQKYDQTKRTHGEWIITDQIF